MVVRSHLRERGGRIAAIAVDCKFTGLRAYAGSSPARPTKRVNRPGSRSALLRRLHLRVFGSGPTLSANWKVNRTGEPGSVRSGCAPQGVGIETSAFRQDSKPDRRAGTRLKRAGAERLGVRDLCYPPRRVNRPRVGSGWKPVRTFGSVGRDHRPPPTWGCGPTGRGA